MFLRRGNAFPPVLPLSWVTEKVTLKMTVKVRHFENISAFKYHCEQVKISLHNSREYYETLTFHFSLETLKTYKREE